MKRTMEAGSLVYPFDFDILVCMQPMNCSNPEEYSLVYKEIL